MDHAECAKHSVIHTLIEEHLPFPHPAKLIPHVVAAQVEKQQTTNGARNSQLSVASDSNTNELDVINAECFSHTNIVQQLEYRMPITKKETSDPRAVVGNE